MKTIEYWMWRYKDPRSGEMRRTAFPLSASEAADRYPDAQRIEGTMTLREVYDHERDTVTNVFHHARM